MLDKLKGYWYHKDVSERSSLSHNQAVGVGRPELKPLERSKILNEGGSLREGGGHAGSLGVLQEEAALSLGNFSCRRSSCWATLVTFFVNKLEDKVIDKKVV
jgi:hypothetical protein